MAANDSSDVATPLRADPGHQLPPAGGETAGGRGVIGLLRELADDTRTLVQQEIALAKMEATHTVKRVVVDSAWIGAGVAIIAVGGLCLVLALALGLGALLDSYWLGTLITGGILFLVGALFAWKGVRDLKKGGFAPTETVESLQDDKDWAERELDDFKQGLRKEHA
jgi:hypothetical protein